jgi:hypothetical protein
MPAIDDMTVAAPRAAVGAARAAAGRVNEPVRKPRGTGAPSPAPAAGPPAPSTLAADRAAEPARPSRIAVAMPASAARDTGNDDVGLHHPVATPPPVAPPPVVAPVVLAAVARPPAVVSTAPQVVSPNVMDTHRIAGQRTILPDEITMTAIGRSGNTTLVSSYKVCISADGLVSTVSQLKSTGFPAYDAKIQATLRREWRYRPYVMNGKPTAVCTAFRFQYSQK